MTLKEALENCKCNVAKKAYGNHIYIAFSLDSVDVYTIDGRYIRKAYPNEYRETVGWKPLDKIREEITGRIC